MPSEQGINSPEIKKIFAELKSFDPAVREKAAEALAEVADASCVPALTELASKDVSDVVRGFAQKALERISPSRSPKHSGEDDFLSIAEDFLSSFEEKPSGAAAKKNAAAAGGEKPSAAVAIDAVGGATRLRLDSILSVIINDDVSKLAEYLAALPAERDPFVKATLLSAIGKLGNYSNMDAVLPFLSDGDRRVVANAIEALENIGNPQAVEFLVRLLPHPDNRIRANAIKALLKIVDESTATYDAVFEKLREMFNSPDRAMKLSAIHVLGELKSEAALEVLKEGLEGCDETVGAKIETAISRIQDDLADESGKTDELIDRVIDKFNQVLSPDVAKGIDEATRAEIDAIQDAAARSDGGLLPEYLERLPGETNPFLKATLITAIGKLGRPGDWKVIAPFLRDQDSRVAANAVDALEKLDNPECIENLIKIISHPDNRVRANVFKAIWKFASSNDKACRLVMDRLRDMLLSNRSELRESAIYVLGEIAGDEAERIISVALEDKNPGVRHKASAALEKVRAKKSAVVSGAAATSGVSPVQVSEKNFSQAVEKSTVPVQPPVPAEEKPQVRVPEPSPPLAAHPASPERDIAPERAVAENLREKAPETVESSLIEKAIEGLSAAGQASLTPKEMDEPTRAEVKRIQATVASGDKSALPKFLAALPAESNPFIKATLIVAIGKLGSKQNMDVLIPFLSDDDVRVVANCVEALEILGNPKCVEALLTVMSHPDNRVRANVSKAIWKFAQSNVTACRLIIDRLKGMIFSSKPQMRESAIFALGEIASDEALELLNLAVNDRSQDIRDKIGEAMEKAKKLREERAKAKAAAPAVSQKPSGKAPAKPKSGKPVSTSQAQAVPAPASVHGGSPILVALIIALSIICSLAGGFYGYWIVYRGSTFEEFAALVAGRQFSQTVSQATIDTVEVAVRRQAPLTTAEIALRDQKRREAYKARMAELLQAQIDEGKEMFSDGYYTPAIAKFKKLMKRHPDNPDIKKYYLEAHFKRAEALFNLEIYPQAKVEYEKVIAIDKKNGNLAFRSSGRLETISKYLKKK